MGMVAWYVSGGVINENENDSGRFLGVERWRSFGNRGRPGVFYARVCPVYAYK